jgi:uncharacterized protein DUF4154
MTRRQAGPRARFGPALLLALACVCGLEAQGPARTESEVKAAYLYSFGRFVQWPTRSDGTAARFTICVLGTDPFGATLDAIVAGTTVRGRNVAVRRLPAVAAATDCDVVFISASEERQLAAILEHLRNADVLTVSDMTQFAERGGMIQFVTVANRVRFEINLSPARQAGLILSSELLRVASTVRGAAGD